MPFIKPRITGEPSEPKTSAPSVPTTSGRLQEGDRKVPDQEQLVTDGPRKESDRPGVSGEGKDRNSFTFRPVSLGRSGSAETSQEQTSHPFAGGSRNFMKPSGTGPAVVRSGSEEASRTLPGRSFQSSANLPHTPPEADRKPSGNDFRKTSENFRKTPEGRDSHISPSESSENFIKGSGIPTGSKDEDDPAEDTSLVSSLLDDLLADDEDIENDTDDDGQSSDPGHEDTFLGYDDSGEMIHEEILDDLLADDEDEDIENNTFTDPTRSSDSSSTVPESSGTVPEPINSEGPSPDRKALLDRLQEIQKDVPEYPVEAQRQAVELSKDVLDRRARRNREDYDTATQNIRNVKKKDHEKRARMTSPFQRTDAKIVQVGENGREDAVRGVAPKRGTKQRYRYARPSGKLNKPELQFFKNIEATQNRAVEGDPITVGKLRRLQGRKNGTPETAAEKKARSLIYAQAVGGRDALRRGAKPRFTWKDKEVLTFLAMFRYATDSHLARLFSQKPLTMRQRLYKLRQQGLVKNMSVYGTTPIWYLTEAGMILSGYDVPRATPARMSFSLFPHQFTVNYVAANLIGAGVNVLMDEDGFPERNRVNAKGEITFGETLVSEIEILSALGKAKNFEKGEVFSPAIRSEIERQFQAWERVGGTESGPSPEMQYGNEYMWALFPPYNMKLAYHVPDLVVRRPRSHDGAPHSIAIEVEINNKPSRAYEKTLRAYKQDSKIFGKVIWICKNIGPARKLEEIAKEIGLYQEGRIKIVPVITENGVFRGRDLWTI